MLTIIIIKNDVYGSFSISASYNFEKNNAIVCESMKQEHKEILINEDSLVVDIQNMFNLYYPYLKIELQKTDVYAATSKSKVNPSFTIRQLIPVPVPQNVNVEPHRTVAELASDFNELLGLSIQVFRKSGNVWNVISLTNGWTLESQNKAGEFISSEMATAY